MDHSQAPQEAALRTVQSAYTYGHALVGGRNRILTAKSCCSPRVSQQACRGGVRHPGSIVAWRCLPGQGGDKEVSDATSRSPAWSPSTVLASSPAQPLLGTQAPAGVLPLWSLGGDRSWDPTVLPLQAPPGLTADTLCFAGDLFSSTFVTGKVGPNLRFPAVLSALPELREALRTDHRMNQQMN